MSFLARFATAPHTLPASILNTLKRSMVGGEPTITTDTFVLAQKDSATYPVYAFRTHMRPLPQDCIDYLVEQCKGPREFKYVTEEDKTRLLFPWTDSGVSKNTIVHNLNILVHIMEAKCTIDEEETGNMRAQLFITTMSWFEAAGFSLFHLKKMCLVEADKEKLAANHVDMREWWKKEEFPKSLVYQSLPVYIDVRYCTGKDVPVFQSSDESVALTVQWLSMITIQYECCKSAPQLFSDYVEDKKRGRVHDTSLPSKIVVEIFQGIADYLIDRRKDLELSNIASATDIDHHIVFVLDDSGSMGSHWAGLVAAVKQYLEVRRKKGTKDRVSIVIFNNTARIACEMIALEDCLRDVESLLSFQSGGTRFGPALRMSIQLLQKQEQGHPIAILFMSDGGSNDGDPEMRELVQLFPEIRMDTIGKSLPSRTPYVLSFGSG
jgi:hypothetical protein